MDADEPESAREFLRRHAKASRRGDADKEDRRGDYRNERATRATQWAEWADLEDWQRVATQEMETEFDLIFSLVDYHTVMMEMESKRGRSFLVFKDADEAESYAVNQVEDQLRDEPELFTQDWLENFINADHLRDQLRSDEENNLRDRLDEDFPGYEEKRDELIRLDRLDRDVFYTEDAEGDEVELPLDDLERVIDSAWDDYIEATIEEQLEDPVQYLKDMLGDEDGMKTAMRIGGINYREAAEAAVSTDGTAHFLASYSGKEIQLPGGAVAYRTH